MPKSEALPEPSTKKKTMKKSSQALATCPVNGAGWCPYPFSVEQLERRLREKAEAKAEAEKSLGASVATKTKSKKKS